MSEQTIQDEPEEETLLELKSSKKAYAVPLTFAVLCLFPIATIPISIIIFGVVWVVLKVNRYTITNERLMLTSGIIARKVEEIELFRIKDVSVSQGIVGRMLNVGDVKVESVDESSPIMKISGIDDPVAVKEQLRKLYRAARKKERVMNTELIYSQ
ncbi:MAG: PH domain-containing protein [Rickettsiales bacterium]|nr:PH domain-containing protein [Rickettsiales bacterium]